MDGFGYLVACLLDCSFQRDGPLAEEMVPAQTLRAFRRWRARGRPRPVLLQEERRQTTLQGVTLTLINTLAKLCGSLRRSAQKEALQCGRRVGESVSMPGYGPHGTKLNPPQGNIDAAVSVFSFVQGCDPS